MTEKKKCTHGANLIPWLQENGIDLIVCRPKKILPLVCKQIYLTSSNPADCSNKNDAGE